MDLGGSFHVGAYDDAGDHNLSIFALDADYNRGPFSFMGEYATAAVDGVAADSRSGYYGQVGFHFVPMNGGAYWEALETLLAESWRREGLYSISAP